MSQKQHHKPFFHIKLFIFTCLWDFKIKILYPLDSTAPSAEDHIVTARIGVALSSIDVALHDHLIIGEKIFFVPGTKYGIRPEKLRLRLIIHDSPTYS